MQLFLVCPAVLAIIQETMSGFLMSALVQKGHETVAPTSAEEGEKRHSPAEQHREQVVASEGDTLSEVSAGSLVVEHGGSGNNDRHEPDEDGRLDSELGRAVASDQDSDGLQETERHGEERGNVLVEAKVLDERGAKDVRDGGA